MPAPGGRPGLQAAIKSFLTVFLNVSSPFVNVSGRPPNVRTVNVATVIPAGVSRLTADKKNYTPMLLTWLMV
jgi:hypothetical protein